MKNVYYFLISVLLFTAGQKATASLSGKAKIDSLLAELPRAKGDTNEVNLLADISFQLNSINPEKGIEYGIKGLKLSRKICWKTGEAKCYNSLGVNYLFKSNYPKALEYFNKALKINEELGDKSGLANNFGNIGIIYQCQSNYPKALKYYTKALAITEELGRKSWIANNLGSIGNIYQDQSNYSKALEYYTKALKISEESGNKSGMATNLGNIGIIYAIQSNYPKALEYFNKAIKIFEELGEKMGIANNLENMGALYLTLSRDSTNLNKMELNKYISLNKSINLNNAIDYSLQAISIYTEIGELDNRSRVLKTLADAYKQKGDYKKWGEALEEHYKLKDSVFSEENAKKIAALEKAREDDIKQKEIEKQKIKIAEQENREQLIIYFSIGFFIIMSIVMIVIYRLLKRSDKLLHNVLPFTIAKRLKNKEHPISDYFSQASIIFIDIVNFTELSKNADPRNIVTELNTIFTKFDTIAIKYGLEKIKTIGDSYMAAAGLPEVQEDNTHRAIQMALEIKQIMSDYRTSDGTKIEVRIGLDCGPVVAGVIGENKFIYDMWSDAVNTASRMESSGVAGQVHISERFKAAISEYDEYEYEERGEMDIKGKGKMKTYFVSEKELMHV